MAIYPRIFTRATSKKTRSTPDYECHLMDRTYWHTMAWDAPRNLDSKYPKWQSVYYHFYRWSRNGTLNKINQALNQLVRIQAGRAAFPSLMCVDSQSVKLSTFIDAMRGLAVPRRMLIRKSMEEKDKPLSIR